MPQDATTRPVTAPGAVNPRPSGPSESAGAVEPPRAVQSDGTQWHITFVVEGPPVPWQRASGRGGKRFTPAKTRAYQQKLAWHMLRARPAGWPLNGEYVLDVGFWFGDRRRRDVDNCLKSIMDAGNGVLWADDSQVRRLGAGRELDAARPRAEIWVEVVDGQA